MASEHPDMLLDVPLNACVMIMTAVIRVVSIVSSGEPSQGTADCCEEIVLQCLPENGAWQYSSERQGLTRIEIVLLQSPKEADADLR